ncbi:hypothetical protein L3X40_19585, partial [Rhizorhapis sp. SPR117]|nr:hypothetical protein [Rhizorhapis sp. SPR117]
GTLLLRNERTPKDPSVVHFYSAVYTFHVVNTDRLATVHTRLAEIYARGLPLRIYPLPFEVPSIEVALQWHSYNDTHPTMIWLRQLMLEVSKEHDASHADSSTIESKCAKAK